MLESLARLSQAHARLMFKDKIEVFDVVCVILLMESSFDTGLIECIDYLDYIILNEEKYK
jgi:DNA helicase MCM9